MIFPYRGAFSIVRRAKQKKTGDMYAVKIIEKKFVEPQDLMLLAREIEIMKKVNHDNVSCCFHFVCQFSLPKTREVVTINNYLSQFRKKTNVRSHRNFPFVLEKFSKQYTMGVTIITKNRSLNYTKFSKQMIRYH